MTTPSMAMRMDRDGSGWRVRRRDEPGLRRRFNRAKDGGRNRSPTRHDGCEDDTAPNTGALSNALLQLIHHGPMFITHHRAPSETTVSELTLLVLDASGARSATKPLGVDGLTATGDTLH